MAQVSSNTAMNFSTFNLYSQLTALPQQFEKTLFLDNINSVLTSATYPGITGSVTSADVVMSWNGPGSYDTATSSFAIGGTDLVLDANQRLASGTVSNLSFKSGSAYSYILGGNVSAASFQAAALTQSTADDLAVLRQMLSGHDKITGSAFADKLFGAEGSDTLNGMDGNDTLLGELGNDQILGGAGADQLDGGYGNDTLNGQTGNDKLVGGFGDDVLLGGAGNDSINGGSGADRITGNIGTDVMYAGIDTVRDVFIFVNAANSAADATRDVIYQFIAGTDDINLAQLDANTALALDQGFAFAGTTAQANSVWYATQGTDVIVFADVDGNTVADFSVKLVAVTAVTAGDFLL